MIFKTTIKTTSFLFIILLLLASCSSPDNSMKAIPAESSFVSVIDIYSLIKKGELSKLKESRFFKDAVGEVRDESKKMSDLLQKAMEDPSSTGIDFTSDLVNFSLNEYKGEHFTCALMKLDDRDDFKEFVTTLLEEAKVEYEIVNNETHSYIEINRERNAIAWDDDKLIFLGANDYGSRENLAYQANRLFILDEDRQLLSNKSFTDFLNKKKDISFWVSSNMLPGIMGKRAYKRMERDAEFDLKGNTLMGHISFEEGEIVMNASIEMNEELKKQYGNSQAFSKEFNEDLLELFPKDHLFVSSFSFDMEKTIETLQQDEKYQDLLKKSTQQSGMDRKSMEEMMENFKAFKGSFLFILFDVENIVIEPSEWQKRYYEENGMEVPVRTQLMPIMGAAFDLGESQFINKMKEEMEPNKENGYYKVREGGVNWYAAHKNSVAFVTNSKSRIENFVKGEKSSENLNDSDIKSEITDNLFFAEANLDFDNYPSILKDEMDKLPSSYERNMFDKWKKIAKKIEMKNTGNSGFQIRLLMANEDQNSLSTLLELAN